MNGKAFIADFTTQLHWIPIDSGITPNSSDLILVLGKMNNKYEIFDDVFYDEDKGWCVLDETYNSVSYFPISSNDNITHWAYLNLPDNK